MPSEDAEWLLPQWPAPARVFALQTTRCGGVSQAPYESLNLGAHVGDSAAAVARNRALLASRLPGNPHVSWLQQVHGTRVVTASRAGGCPEADACVSREPGLACAVMTADCLPLLLADRAGTCVAAVHAGWRGLQAGVVEAAVEAVGVAPEQLLAWLGPAIGSADFEVGPEVRAAFLDDSSAAGLSATDNCFTPAARPDHYLADLYQLTRLRLASLGTTAVYGGDLSTTADPGRFFSYRREGITGRMASLIMLLPD